MKKNWQETFYNIVALLCLLQCLYPWTFNLCNIRARGTRQRDPGGGLSIDIELNSKNKLFDFSYSPQTKNDAGDKLLKFVDRLVKNSWLSRPHDVQTYIFTESFLQPMAPQSNITVRLLDVNGNNGNLGSNVVRRNELSLEDIDVIDCLWRQDIDAEKGMYGSIQPLENQFETDMQMLSEKSFPQQRLMNAPSGNNYQTYESYLKSYDDDFMVSQKKFDGYDPYFWSDAQTYSDGKVSDEKQLYVEWEKDLAASLNSPLFDQQTTHQFTSFSTSPSNQQNGSVNQTLIVSSNNNSDLLAPLNDVMLTSVATNTTDYSLLSIFDEPDISIDVMDWSTPQMQLDQFSPNVDLANSAHFIESSFDFAAPNQRPIAPDVDSIVTPSLELSTNDINQLFSDRQVALDIANAYEHKTELPDIRAMNEASYYPTASRQSVAGVVSPYASSFNPETFDDGDFEIMSEFFHSETPGPREKSSSVPIMQQFPDYNTPSTSYNSIPVDITACSSRDSSDSPGQSSIDHDHHYCSSSENVVEVEVSTSPTNSYDERKIMPLPIVAGTPSIKKSYEDDEEELDEYLFASSKDEELATKLNLPVTATDVINMSAVRFAKLLKDPSFTTSQTDLIRKIRRRGRNKVAAQNCRQRRLDDLQQLSTEVRVMERERDVLRSRQREMIRLKNIELKRVNDLNNKRNQRKV